MVMSVNVFRSSTVGSGSIESKLNGRLVINVQGYRIFKGESEIDKELSEISRFSASFG